MIKYIINRLKAVFKRKEKMYLVSGIPFYKHEVPIAINNLKRPLVVDYKTFDELDCLTPEMDILLCNKKDLKKTLEYDTFA